MFAFLDPHSSRLAALNPIGVGLALLLPGSCESHRPDPRFPPHPTEPVQAIQPPARKIAISPTALAMKTTRQTPPTMEVHGDSGVHRHRPAAGPRQRFRQDDNNLHRPIPIHWPESEIAQNALRYLGLESGSDRNNHTPAWASADCSGFATGCRSGPAL